MAFVPGQFLSNIKARGGPAKTNRFEVIMTIPFVLGNEIRSPNGFLEAIVNPGGAATNFIGDFLAGPGSDLRNSKPDISRMLALQCETASLPGKTLQTVDAKTYGPTFKIPVGVQYQNFQMVFLCTNDFYERKIFDRWMDYINPRDTRNLRYPRETVDGLKNYYSKISIIQYDDFVKQAFAVDLYDAFPVSISAQQLSWSDDNFHRLTIDFAYQYYNPVYEGRYDAEAIASAVIGNIGGRIQDFVGRTASDALGGITSNIPGLGGRF